MKLGIISCLIFLVAGLLFLFIYGDGSKGLTKDCGCEQHYYVGNAFNKSGEVAGIHSCSKNIGGTVKWGFMFDDNSCNIYLPFIYDQVGYFSDGAAPVARDGKWGAIDSTGRVVIPFVYIKLFNFSDSVAAYQADNGLWGFINTRGEMILEAQYDFVTKHANHLALARYRKQNGKNGWRVLNSKGRIVPIIIDSLRNQRDEITHEREFENKPESWYAYTHHGVPHYEILGPPVYSNGKLVQLLTLDKSYAIIPFDFVSRLDSAQIELLPIFEAR